MFETRIQNTKLAGSLADCMFRRINGCAYEGDYSFISTLRALLMNRITGDSRIEFKTYGFALTNEQETMTTSLESCIRPDTIAYVSVSRNMAEDDDTSKQTFFAFPAPEHLHEFMDVRSFFAEKMACRAFICEQSRSAIIVVLSSDMKKHHLAQCIIPKLLPWFFREGRISVNERSLLFGLRERMPAQYLRAIENICDTDSFRQKSASAALLSWKRKGLERQKKTVEQSIVSCNNTIERLNSDLLSELRRVNQENFRLNGILLALESDDSGNDDLAEFIAGNRHVRFIDSQSEDMRFVVTGYLDIYDPEAYRSMARNQYCWYWAESATSSGPFMQREARKLVMDAIFSDSPVFKIKTYGVYKLDLEHNSVSATGGRHDNIDDVSDRYPNPHLNYASCLGSYRPHINRALQSGDLVGAISQCITSVHSVNVTESATFRHLCSDIFRNNEPILEGPNGQSFTTLQAYQYLTNKNNNEGE